MQDLKNNPEIRELIKAPKNMGRYVHRTRDEVRDSIFSEGLYCREAFYSTATFLSRDESEALRNLMSRHLGSTAHIIVDIPNQVRRMTLKKLETMQRIKSQLLLDPSYFFNGLIPPQLIYGSFNPDTLTITLNPRYNPYDSIVLTPKWEK